MFSVYFSTAPSAATNSAAAAAILKGSGTPSASKPFANATAMRPNDEFYLMGRVPRPRPA